MRHATTEPARKRAARPEARRSPAAIAPSRGGRLPAADRRLDEVETIARIGSYSLDVPAGRWVSSAGLDAIFGIDARFERSIAGWAALIHPAEREAMVAYFRDEVLGRAEPFDREYRIVQADSGVERWVHGRGALELDPSGRPVRMVGTIADITPERQAHEALVRSELRYAAIFDGALEAILVAELETGRFRWVNPAACALLGYSEAELLGLTVRDIHPPADLPRILGLFGELAEGRPTGAQSIPCRRRDGTTLLADIKGSIAVLDGVACTIGFFSDVTELRRLKALDGKLAQAVEQTSDSVIITDLRGTIEYVNPAFERVSGYRREEAVGANPRILKSGHQSAGFYDALWRRLTRGESWTGTLVNRRKDGSLYEEVATISPIRDPAGAVSAYVAVKRDVTALRAAETDLERTFREHAQVIAALARLRPGPTAEATAAEICAELFGLPGVDLAAVFTFVEPTEALTLAVAGPVELQLSPGQLLPTAIATYLHGRAEQGPWAEAWPARSDDSPYAAALAELGIRAIAYAPIRTGDRLLGLVGAGTRDEPYARHLIDHLPAVGEFAATASALLGRQLERGHRDDQVRAHVGRVLAGGGFRPVFQPIVDLATGAPVGYEALTRFTDGTPPDQLIGEAHAIGLGLELEVACLAAALTAAESLPSGCWLSVNVSPDVLRQASGLARLLAERPRPIVIELTEHAEIADYGAVRRAIGRLGPTVRLAVDDAGAGFASLRHIVELRPQFLKLDLSLVRHVDRDLARQAMIAGLTQFAARAGSEVIAEGIESPAELEMVRELGVPLAQGYLLGRPGPAPAPAGSGRRRPARSVREPKRGASRGPRGE
jgi:PAS domain S-box-containing protein